MHFPDGQIFHGSPPGTILFASVAVSSNPHSIKPLASGARWKPACYRRSGGKVNIRFYIIAPLSGPKKSWLIKQTKSISSAQSGFKTLLRQHHQHQSCSNVTLMLMMLLGRHDAVASLTHQCQVSIYLSIFHMLLAYLRWIRRKQCKNPIFT